MNDVCTEPRVDGSEHQTEPRGWIGGRYRVIRRLGRGGMGEVLLADDHVLARRVAIKRSRSAAPDHGKLRREARIAARLAHRSVVRVYDVVRDEGLDHLVMEYVPGPSLFDLHLAGPTELVTVIQIAIELAGGLASAHEHGVLHLDVKLENVLLGTGAQPKLTDFGIARCIHEVDLELDPASQLIGTPRAMSPEQIQGDDVDERSDLYSLGVLMFELLTGTSPFAAGNELQTLSRVLGESAPSVDTYVPAVPRELAELVGAILEKSPAARPRSARELESRLWSITASM